MVSLEKMFRIRGPCLSSELAQDLVGNGLSPDAARKRISRAIHDQKVSKLSSIRFPHNTQFIYLPQDFRSPEYWQNLIEALEKHHTAYGLALGSIQQRGGIMPLKHFPIACGAPIQQKGHLSQNTVLERLDKAGLVDQPVVTGVGPCVAFPHRDTARYAEETDRLRARLIAECFLLETVALWLQRLGFVSYGKVHFRDEREGYPRVSTFAWDLTAPSYLAPMVSKGRNQKDRPGFIACDILLGTEINATGLRPFLHKISTLRSLSKVGRCLHIFVADSYTFEAFNLAKKNRIVPATVSNLFGIGFADGFDKLVEALTLFACAISDSGDSGDGKFDEIFAQLQTIERTAGRNDGLMHNMRGSLFEFVSAELARIDFSPTYVLMNHILPGDAVEGGKKKEKEVDVIAVKNYDSVHFIECKGYSRHATIPDEYVETWLENIRWIRTTVARNHVEWRNLSMHFEFWATGRLSPVAISMLNERKSNARGYHIDYSDADALWARVKKTRCESLMKVFKTYFRNSPKSISETFLSSLSSLPSDIDEEIDFPL